MTWTHTTCCCDLAFSFFPTGCEQWKPVSRVKFTIPFCGRYPATNTAQKEVGFRPGSENTGKDSVGLQNVLTVAPNTCILGKRQGKMEGISIRGKFMRLGGETSNELELLFWDIFRNNVAFLQPRHSHIPSHFYS